MGDELWGLKRERQKGIKNGKDNFSLDIWKSFSLWRLGAVWMHPHLVLCEQTCEFYIRPSAPVENLQGFPHLDFPANIWRRSRKEEERITWSEKNGKREPERDRKGLELERCCCWHLLKGFSVRQEAGLTGSVSLQLPPPAPLKAVTQGYHTHRKSPPNGSFILKRG